MDFDEFRDRLEKAEKLGGREAVSVLESLAESDLPALDRALAWVQAAEARDRLGDVEGALSAYDRARALEEPLSRFQASFRKADYLLRLGRKDESRAAFQSLLARPEATLAERGSIESRLKLLRRKT